MANCAAVYACVSFIVELDWRGGGAQKLRKKVARKQK